MILRDISFHTPDENVLFDDLLLMRMEREGGGGFLRFWESPIPFIVLGRISRQDEDLWLDRVQLDRIPVIRRSSGGGTVLQGPGCLNYSLIVPKDDDPEYADVNHSYRRILGKIIDGLAFEGLRVDFRPLSDMILLSATNEERKFSGNAQRRARHYFLHHGTILFDFNLKLMEQYLRIPEQMPEYRQGRPHSDFVTNMALPLTRIKKILMSAFGIESQDNRISTEEMVMLQSLKESRKAEKNGLSFESFSGFEKMGIY